VNSGAHARFLALLPGFLAQRRTLVWLLAGALAVRLGAFLAFQRILDFQVAGVIHGSVAYDTYARNLLSTGVYGLTPGLPDAVLPPLYSALVAAVYRTAGRGTLQIVLLNAAFDLLALLALRRIGARLFPPGPAIGTLAAACTAFYPYLVFQSLTVVDTSVFIGLLYCFLATVVALRDVRNGPAIWTRGMFCGVLLGLTTLTRPVTPPLAVFVALWLALTVGWRSAIQRLLPVALGAVVVIAPWVARNSWTFGTPVAITTNAGSNFWQGNNPDTLKYLRAGYDVQWTSPPPITAADPLGPEADAELFRHAMAYLRAQPGDVPALLWTKLRVQWSFDVAPRVNPSAEGPRAAAPGAATARIDDASGTLELGGLPRQEPVVSYSRPLFDRFGRWVHRLYWGGLFLLGILGSLLTWRRWRDVSILWFWPLR
jgi:4-amino-4-deoxy-L-arabinose transferase-like glycosyltransferase